MTESGQASGPGRGLFVVVFAAVAAATLAAAAATATRAWRMGIPGEWQWAFYPRPGSWITAVPAMTFAAMLAVVVGACLGRVVPAERWEAGLVVVCLLLGLGVILSMTYASPQGDLVHSVLVTADPWVSGYFAESARIRDMGAYLARYPERISALTVKEPFGHLADHPVGPVLFHWLVNRLMEAWPEVARWFTPRDPMLYSQARALAERLARTPLSDGAFAGIWASALLFRLAYWAALVPVYLLGRALHSREAGLAALALAALIPALHLFAPYPDQVFPLFALWALYGLYRAVERGSAVWGAVSALGLVLGLLWTLAFLAVVLMMAVAVGLLLVRAWTCGQRIGRGAYVRAGVGWGGGLVVFSLLPWAALGYDAYRVWRICLVQHGTFADLFPRTYTPWVLFNPLEFVLFAGVAAGLLLLFEAWTEWREWWSRRRLDLVGMVTWSLLATLAVLNFSGKNLGEVGRLWMPFMPFAAVGAGTALARLDRSLWWAGPCVVALSAVQLAVFKLHVKVFGIV